MTDERRDRFAESAMRELLRTFKMNPALGQENFKIIAEAARNMADAMIVALRPTLPESPENGEKP